MSASSRSNARPQKSDSDLAVDRVDLDELLTLRWQSNGLDLSAKRRVLTSLAGGHSSGFRGRGVDFDELRHYSPGDDIRLMDWKVTARSQAPHIRVFKEERERPVWVVVDQGASMQFATQGRFKSVRALQVAGLLVWAGLANGDRVGGMSWGGSQSVHSAPGHRRESALALLRQWSTAQPSAAVAPQRSQPTLQQTLAMLRRHARPGSLAFVISDFNDFDAAAERQLTLLQRHVQVVVVAVSDPIEQQAPPAGVYAFMGEDGQRQAFDLRTESSRQRYSEVMQARRQPLLLACRKLGIHVLGVSTTDDVPTALRAGLQGGHTANTAVAHA